LAIKEDKPVGMIGGGVSQANRYNLIGMWVEPAARGSGVATQLVEAVKSRAIGKGHDRVFLDVSADNARVFCTSEASVNRKAAINNIVANRRAKGDEADCIMPG
jgi:GNAT superfamily N-acetyltransferase